MSKEKMKKTNTIHFNIQRKIVANMTTESWVNVPHVTYNYEPDVTDFMIEYKRLNQGVEKDKKITLNTVMLKIIVEGLKADPVMNSHIDFNSKLVRGQIHTYEDINISMPMVLPNGEMMTINLHNFEKKNLDEMTAYIADVNRRIENTDLNEVMFDVSFDNTITGLKQGKIGQTLNRLIGSKTGKHKVKTLRGKEKREYYSIPEKDRLTKSDIEQGTVTVSNIGSVYREQRGATCLLEIVPPQICAFAVGAVQDRPVVVADENGNKEIAIRQILPLCIAFDHRALDFGEIVPFIKRLDEIFAAPEEIHTWKAVALSDDDMAEIKHEREERSAKYEQSREWEKKRREAEKLVEKAEKEAKEAEKKRLEAEQKAQKIRMDHKKHKEHTAESVGKMAKQAEDAELEAAQKMEQAMKDAEEKIRREAEKELARVEQKAKREAEKVKKEAAEKLRKEVEKSEKLRSDLAKAEEEAAKAKELEEFAKKKAEEAKLAVENLT